MRLNLIAKSEIEIAILAYLEENASDALVEKIKYGNTGKTMADCIRYIREKARKKASNGVAVIKDAEVFGWAVHYFEEDALKPGAKDPDEQKAEEIKKKAEEKHRIEYEEFKKKKMEMKLGLDGQISMFELM